MKGPTVYFWDMEKYGEPKSIKEAKAIVAKYGDQQCDPNPVVKSYIDAIIFLQDFYKEKYKYGPIIDAGDINSYEYQAVNKIDLPDGNWSAYCNTVFSSSIDKPIAIFMPEHEIIVKSSENYCPPSARKKWDALYEEMNPRFPRTEEDFRNFVTKKIMEVLPEGIVLKKEKTLPERNYDAYDYVLEFESGGVGFYVAVAADKKKYENKYGLLINIGVIIPRHFDIIEKFDFSFRYLTSVLWFSLFGDIPAGEYIPHKFAPEYPRNHSSMEDIYSAIKELDSNLKVIMAAVKSPVTLDRLLNSNDSPYMPYAHTKFRMQHALIAARFVNNPEFDFLVDKFRDSRYFHYSETKDDLGVTYPAFVRYLREEVQPLENI